MPHLNKVIIMGHLGRDPESRNGAVSFSVAVGERWKDKSGEQQERTEWFNVTAFGKLGEICEKYLRKGSAVYVEGKFRTEKYAGKDGTEKTSTKVIADQMQMVGGNGERAGGDSKPARAEPKQESFDDEIPF